MNWQNVKERAWFWYARTSQFLLFCNLLMYLACCAVVEHPVGPVGYIGFLYHCTQWKVG